MRNRISVTVAVVVVATLVLVNVLPTRGIHAQVASPVASPQASPLASPVASTTGGTPVDSAQATIAALSTQAAAIPLTATAHAITQATIAALSTQVARLEQTATAGAIPAATDTPLPTGTPSPLSTPTPVGVVGGKDMELAQVLPDDPDMYEAVQAGVESLVPTQDGMELTIYFRNTSDVQEFEYLPEESYVYAVDEVGNRYAPSSMSEDRLLVLPGERVRLSMTTPLPGSDVAQLTVHVRIGILLEGYRTYIFTFSPLPVEWRPNP